MGAESKHFNLANILLIINNNEEEESSTVPSSASKPVVQTRNKM